MTKFLEFIASALISFARIMTVSTIVFGKLNGSLNTTKLILLIFAFLITIAQEKVLKEQI